VLRYALLALLSQGDRHGYELKVAFEDLLAGMWSLNIGQVYTTLARLERDGLVIHRLEPQEIHPDRKTYSLTEAGREELVTWLSRPEEEIVRLKDESVLKVLLHGVTDAGDVRQLLWAQRDRCLEALADLADLRDSAETPVVTRLAVEAAMLHVEADLRWLDTVEEAAADLAGGGD